MVCVSKNFDGLRTTGLALICAISVVASDAPLHGEETPPTRVTQGLQVLYDFSGNGSGGVVRDQSESSVPLDLTLVDRDAVNVNDKRLQVLSPTLVRSDRPAIQLMDAVRKSQALSIEVWFRPADLEQSGPARIVTLSRNGNQRNFTLGQDGAKIDVRLRTSKTSKNGIPSFASRGSALKPELTHVVYTRSPDGRARIFINGELNAEGNVPGEISNWTSDYRLGLANELSKGRPWRGVYRLVAVYSRGLSEDEVQRNFRAGPRVQPLSEAERLAVKEAQRVAANAELFERRVAAVLSQNCLECHDSATSEGGLDLSRRTRALAGGEQGPVLIANEPEQSLLWTLVKSDEMPQERPPLSDAEKDVLHKWIGQGAAWTLDQIDPAIYVHGEQSQSVFVQRLTVPEYIATVRVALGVDVADEARQHLPRDLRADGFSNTAYNLGVDLDHIEAYARLAEIIVGKLDVGALRKRHTKNRELTDENVTRFVKRVGKRLLRAPVTEEEIQRYCGISTSVAAAGGDIDEAVAFVVEAMLQSPRFLYRVERQRGDGSRWPVSQHELASRLSFILWGAGPDTALLKAADEGQLNREAARDQFERMIADPRAIERSRRFIVEWLNLDRLDNLRPDPEAFPDWDPRLAGDMRRETLEYFEEIAWRQQRPLGDLLNAQLTFATPRLALHYNLPVEVGGPHDRLQRVDLSGVEGRGGLLTHGSLLTVGGDEASTVTRGLFVMHELLRGVVRDPPPCVDTTPIPTAPGLTRRAIAEQRLADQSCGGCHARFEPLSFALERFDGLGSFHKQDRHGNLLREDGDVLIPGADATVKYESTAELMDLLATSQRVQETLTWKATQFALGRSLGPDDAAIVAGIHQAAQEGGGTWKSLMSAIIMSDLVWTTRTEPDERQAPNK